MRPVALPGVEIDVDSRSAHDRHQGDEECGVAATPHLRDRDNEQKNVGTDADRRVVDQTPFLRHGDRMVPEESSPAFNPGLDPSPRQRA